MRGGTRKPVAGGRALYRVVDPPGSFVDEPDAGRVVLQDLHPLAPAGLVERGAETGVVTNQCRVHLFLVGGPSRALSLADVEDAQLPLRLRASCTTGPRGRAARSPPLDTGAGGCSGVHVEGGRVSGVEELTFERTFCVHRRGARR